MDWIHVKDLQLRCVIGVSPEERRERDDILVSFGLFTDLSEAMRSDDIHRAVDYRAIKKAVLASVEGSSHYLIEALAGRVAAVCLSFAGVKEVTVRVEKPSALRFARSVGVEITRSCEDLPQEIAYIGLGSNIDARTNIPLAVALLSKRVRVRGVSAFYETDAVGGHNLPPFINGVVEIGTPLRPDDLKNIVLRGVEDSLGRKRSEDKYAARPIDLDILVYGDQVIRKDSLIIPDPAITDRPFLAVPLAELAGNRLLPGTNRRIDEIAQRFASHRMKSLPDLVDKIRSEVLR